MTATLALEPLAGWRPLEAAVAEIRGECSQVQQLVEEQFDEIDRLRETLLRQADELSAAEERLAQRTYELENQRHETAHLTQQLQLQGAQLSETLAELRALREQVSLLQPGDRHEAAPNAPAVAQVDNLSPLMSVLDELRHEVHDTRSELAGAIQQAASAHVEQAQSAGDSLSLETTQHLVALERQRAELEAELELVRTRAAELQATVNEQKRELADQRDELTAELRLLRELVEQQAELHAIPPVASEPALPQVTIRPPQPAAQAAAVESSAAADPVVNSVMAQFARLQKDVAQRRQQKKK